MSILRSYRLLIITGLSLCACLSSENFDQGNVRYSFFDFSDGLQNWSAGFTGHSSTDRMEDYFEAGHAMVPGHFNESKAMRIKGKNQDEKLFMFIKRQIHGLDPNANYQIDCEVRLISDLLAETENNKGIDVFFKYSTSTIEPLVVANAEKGRNELNLDTISREESGGEIKYVEKINPPISKQIAVDQVINSYNRPLLGRTDAEGKLWVLMGTELHSQAEMAFYYNTIVIYYTRL